MVTYDDKTLECIPPVLQRGEKEHVLVIQNETVFHTNEYHWHVWLADDQQPIQKKGSGRAIHISDFICETIRPIKLSEEQIKDQLSLPNTLSLPTFEVWTITYPRKGFDSWWDLAQLIKQLKNMIAIFEYTHPNCKRVFIFDRSSAHEGYAENALNINNMNINSGRKQKKMHDMMIPRSNPDLAPGEEDTCGQIQKMCFSDSHNDLDLHRKAKGIRVVL
jgi:hypothetical protein